MSKYLFFDIDGTLTDFGRNTPKSALFALEKVREKGHKCFLCTGRSKNQIYPHLLEGPFDGIVAGAGAYAEVDGKEIYHETMGEKSVQKLINLMMEQGCGFILQSMEGIISNKKALEKLNRHFMEERKKNGELKEAAADELLKGIMLDEDISSYGKRHAGAEGLSYCDSSMTVNQMQEILGPELKVTTSSYHTPDPFSGEVTRMGINKATGMAQILAYYGAGPEDAIGFGDAANDLDMIRYAGIGVAMGNAQEIVKQEADFVTRHISDDGIYYACEKLGLF